MLSKKTIFATTLLSGMMITGAAQANETEVQREVNKMMEAAVTKVQMDIQNELQGSLRVASKSFDQESGKQVYLAKLDINDLLPKDLDTAPEAE